MKNKTKTTKKTKKEQVKWSPLKSIDQREYLRHKPGGVYIGYNRKWLGGWSVYHRYRWTAQIHLFLLLWTREQARTKKISNVLFRQKFDLLF
jgi:hypothetical protein